MNQNFNVSINITRSQDFDCKKMLLTVKTILSTVKKVASVVTSNLLRISFPVLWLIKLVCVEWSKFTPRNSTSEGKRFVFIIIKN